MRRRLFGILGALPTDGGPGHDKPACDCALRLDQLEWEMPQIELTEAQLARVPEFADRWTKIGLCTEPADRPRAEAAIREMYRQGGLDPPAKIVWCGSPLSQVFTREMVKDFDRTKTIWPGVGVPIYNSVFACIWDSVRVGRGGGVWDV